jgi:hypothetical protein
MSFSACVGGCSLGWQPDTASFPDGQCAPNGYCVGFDQRFSNSVFVRDIICILTHHLFVSRSHAWYIAKGTFSLLMSGVDFRPSLVNEQANATIRNELSATIEQDEDEDEVGVVQKGGLLHDSDLLSLTGGLEFQAVMRQIGNEMSHDDKRQRLSLRVAINRLKYLYASYLGRDCMTRWQWHERRA